MGSGWCLKSEPDTASSVTLFLLGRTGCFDAEKLVVLVVVIPSPPAGTDQPRI